MNQNSSENVFSRIEQKKIRSFETSMGSSYRYLPDGRTQRFKKVENREYEPQDVIVFIPDWNTLLKKAPKEFIDRFDGNENEFEQQILSYSREMKIYIINEDGKKMTSNQEAQSQKSLFLAFCKESRSEPDFMIPVVTKPKEGWTPYDTRKYFDETEKQWKRDQHIGNEVVKINY